MSRRGRNGRARQMSVRLGSRDIAYYYSEFYGRMVRDIGREIEWQRLHPHEVAGNMLCALALVAYTEVLGGVARRELEGHIVRNEAAFLAFLGRMAGGRYEAFRKQWQAAQGVTLYDALRNGVVHEYVPKVGTRVWFVFEEEETLGLGQTAEFALTLNIRPYFEDFRKSGEELFKELREAASRREGGSA